MRVKALRNFNDLKEKTLREKGNEFEVSEERFTELNATEHGVLVEAVDEGSSIFPKHTGGGYYELSNGEKVRGKEAAFKAENELK